MSTNSAGFDLEILSRPVRLEITLNELRIIVGCLRAIAYQAKVDGEPYLDPDAVELKRRLEKEYERLVEAPDGKDPD